MNIYNRFISIALVLCVLLSFFVSCGPGSMDFFIFSDISEMETLASDERFDRYDNPSEDRKLDGLLYDVAVCGEYSSDELSFEIFAYFIKLFSANNPKQLVIFSP